MIIDGKKISEKILKRLQEEIKEKQLKLKLAVVLVGDDSSSKIYVSKKEEACHKIGIDFQLFKFSSEIKGAKLFEEVVEIIKDDNISGLVVQLPLPEHIDTDEILNSIPKAKDVESISPVVCAIKYILEEYDISLKNKKIALIGRGKLVGIPVAKWLGEQDLKFSNNIGDADIIISGAGKPGLLKKEMVKDGAVVIDVGGDVEEDVFEKAGYITPRIGGIGPITVACLLEQLLRLNLNR